MKIKDVAFSICSAVIPAIVYEKVQKELANSVSADLLWLFVIVVTVLILIGLFYFFSVLPDGLCRYHGQWVERLKCVRNGKTELLIAIGEIRYDRKTEERVFVGKTYSTDGKPEYEWSIDYLRQNKDNAFEYVCGATMQGERSIGELSFLTSNECTGAISVMDGTTYTYEAERITKKLAQRIGFHKKCFLFRRWLPWSKSIRIALKDCPEFVCSYAKWLSQTLRDGKNKSQNVPSKSCSSRSNGLH